MKARRGKSRIRKSTDGDLHAIYTWLTEQDARKIPGTFLCNWGLTEKSHQEGKLLVYIDGVSELPVAYQWGSLLQPGILEVRHDMRGKGIGRKLVEHRIKQATKHNQCFLVIQCKPSSSIRFWQHMGFTLFNSTRGENFAFRVLEKKHQFPSKAAPVEVAIRFFPEERKWNAKTPAYYAANPNAASTSEGIAHLAERVLFFSELHPDSGDTVVEVEVEGNILICDKAKYPEARNIGVQRCDGGFYLDAVRC